MSRIVKTALALLVLLACLAGCATAPPPAPPTRPAVPVSPAPGTTVGTTASGGSIRVNEPPASPPAVVDSTPSPEALAVLGTIPDPPGSKPQSDPSHVPVPGETQPLGDRPGPTALPESPAPPSAPQTSGPPPRTAPSSAPASGDSCWCVQVLAPPERDRAERMVEVAGSQLMTPFEIEAEGGLFKVRSRGCLSATAANDLRSRAVAAGFDGAFRLRKPRR